jgi:hypothetical protein
MFEDFTTAAEVQRKPDQAAGQVTQGNMATTR